MPFHGQLYSYYLKASPVYLLNHVFEAIYLLIILTRAWIIELYIDDFKKCFLRWFLVSGVPKPDSRVYHKCSLTISQIKVLKTHFTINPVIDFGLLSKFENANEFRWNMDNSWNFFWQVLTFSTANLSDYRKQVKVYDMFTCSVLKSTSHH